MPTKMDDPSSVAFLNQAPIFKWYVVRCGSTNIFQKDMCSKEIGLCAQNVKTIPDNISKSCTTHFMSMRMLTSISNNIII